MTEAKNHEPAKQAVNMNTIAIKILDINTPFHDQLILGWAHIHFRVS